MSEPVNLLAVHGNGGGAIRFTRLVRRMPPGVALRTVTVPGFGGVPADPRLRTMDDYGAWLAREIGAMPHPRALLGHGIGGSWALAMLQRPVELDALILHAPVGAHLDTRRLPRAMRLPGAPELTRRVIAARVVRPLLRRRVFDTNVPRELSDRFFEGYSDAEAFAQMFRIITPEWFDGLRPIEVPTALLWGERDQVLGAGQIDELRRVAPGAIERVIAGWGHFPMIDRPTAYAKVVTDLLRALIDAPEPATTPGQ